MRPGREGSSVARRGNERHRARGGADEPCKERPAAYPVWNPFMDWESSLSALETDPADRRGSESIENALPASVETADEEDAVMAPEGFMHWF